MADTSTSQGRQPAAGAWPAGGTETVAVCPVCGGSGRVVQHQALTDNAFRCAPGTWTLWRCTDCRSAFLDPRPTPATIHLAYEGYYTHGAPHSVNAERGLARLKRAISNGYKNWRFGTRLQPATAWGVPATFLMAPIRARIDREYRHMPVIPGGGRVLDIGFGDASFLQCATQMGWTAIGIDTDPSVVANARRKGLAVSTSSLDDLQEPEQSFDVITAAHVLEHVHDPRAFVRRCFQLLKPGGLLWLETPNVDSHGHARFGVNWRGLEAPRHLALFTSSSLRRLLQEAGFGSVRDLPQSSPVRSMYTMSDRMRRGLSPYADEPISPGLRLRIAAAEVTETLRPSRREFLTLAARKAAGEGA